ncbi:MAG: NAD(P)/FAD-dependent oxidoreductase [Chloroherpetonaceae bacterium]|nr:NAD(P)/FAD-dependent oxidoreductase [Chthonomonadaceae bacterium]MDW8208414.1 NAD(P)/FAD-dependent oxidoreductase [Chloroherpetonaceae bacterium]
MSEAEVSTVERPGTAIDTLELPAEDLYDITIVGGGPVGLFGAFYAGLRQMKTKIIDSLPELGGQLNALYPEKYVYDMPGFPKILARDLAEQLIQQAMRFNPTICLNEKVLRLAHQPDGTIVLETQKGVHHTRTVVLATGAGAFSPTKLDTPGVNDYEGRGVFYFVRDKSQFTGKRLLIVGGGDSALDWAMNLEEQARQITLIHRRDVFRAHEESVDWLLHRSRVNVMLWHELRRVEGNGWIERAVVFHNKTGEETTLEVDAILLNLGFKADIGPLREWGLALHGNRKVVVNQLMETNLPGVYAAGDIAHSPGKLDLIATGVGEICIAVNFAKTRIDPTAKAFPGHSSNMSLS